MTSRSELSPEARAVLNDAARNQWWTSTERDPAPWIFDARQQEAMLYAVNNIAKVEAGLAAALEWVKDHEDVNYEGTGPNDAMALGQEIREAMVRVEGKTTQC